MPEGMKYQIHYADRADCPPVPNTQFTDPQEAAKKAKELSREIGEKLMVKIIKNDRWKYRESERFRDGTYRPLPWNRAAWWIHPTTVQIWNDHYAHPSMEKPGWLAYTKNDEDGMRDKQTVVRPGAYLNKYFSEIMSRYGVSERACVEQFMLAFGPIEVKFATTEDEIATLYSGGFETCMNKGWDHDSHPCRIYAYGDLQVAYLGTLENAKARTVVWPEKKIHSRVYGDIARLTSGLERLGYKWGAPIGAKLKRIQVREPKFNPDRGMPCGCFVAPYLDKKNQQGGGHLGVIDRGTHLEICEDNTLGSHHCGGADGYSGLYVPRQDEVPTFTCDRCGTPGQRELLPVHTHAPEDWDEEDDTPQWCDKCVGRAAWRCGWSGDLFSSETVRPVAVDGAHWTKYSADMYAAKCEMTGALCNKDNMKRVYFGNEKKPKLVSKIYIQKSGGVFRSNITAKIYLTNEMKIIVHDGAACYVSRSELTQFAFQCDGCDSYYHIDNRIQSHGDDRLFCQNCDRLIRLGENPVSKTRKAFDLQRKQLNLIAAE